MVDRVLSELADAGAGITVVIDDLHELTSPEALSQLTRLLTNLPPHVHAILTTRHDLRLGLHQLRLAGELAEIRAADLRFSERETRELLDASGIALSEAGAALLHQRTEGWAAGLRRAASPWRHPDPERFVAEFSGSDRTVAEYLIAEMLERQPADVQDLLLRTSLLDRVNGELADVLTGRPGRNGSCWNLRTRTRSSSRWTPSGRGSGTTTCSGICSGWSYAGGCPTRCRRCTGGPPDGSPSTARWSTPSGTPRRRATGPMRPGCWPTIGSAWRWTGQAQTMQALVRAFPPGQDHPELALVRAGGDLVQGRLDEAAAHLAVAETYGSDAARSASTTGAVNTPPTLRAAATSRANRIRNPGSLASSARITFTATRRPPGDRPRNTWPIPPAPNRPNSR